MRHLAYLILFCISFLFLCCKQKNNQVTSKEIEQYKKNLIDAHKGLIRKDADSIKKTVTANNWSMIETKTGLWYEIYEKGNGPEVEAKDKISLRYDLSLLNGTPCYNSDSLGILSFIVGQGNVESGLEEGVLRLHQGDKARFVLPPHLAHGVIGDQNKIPRLAIIVYDVEVINIIKHEE